METIDRRALLAAAVRVLPLTAATARGGLGLARASVPASHGGDGRVGYHRRFILSPANELVEIDAGQAPVGGAVRMEALDLARRQRSLNQRLSSDVAQAQLTHAPPMMAGIYPLKVRSFVCSCEGRDEDGAAAQLIDRLGNLRIITQVPFMRRGNIIFAIRSQGLVDPRTGAFESVDALFSGGIYWRGRLTRQRLDYELLMFRVGKDHFVGRMAESIDLTRKAGDIDPALYQAEVGYHLNAESNDAGGHPTLPRPLDLFGSSDRIDRVAHCYHASAAFGAAAKDGRADLAMLAQDARAACADVPAKRYYQAYDVWLRGIGYDPTTAGPA